MPQDMTLFKFQIILYLTTTEGTLWDSLIVSEGVSYPRTLAGYAFQQEKTKKQLKETHTPNSFNNCIWLLIKITDVS